jgi:hypothetical protein
MRIRLSRGGTPLGRFVVTVLIWLPITFALWYIASPILLWPAALLSEAIARMGFGDLVRAADWHGATLSFITTLRPGGEKAGGVITVDVDLLLYSFGLPLFAALTLAAREERWPRRLAIGYVVILPFVAWGTVAELLKVLAISSGPQVASQTGFVAWQREVIAFAYQFGALILPAVVPAVTWVLTHRRYLERLRAATTS